MSELKQYIENVADFPRPGILFRDISPLLRTHFDATLQALEALLTPPNGRPIDAIAGIESRGFILGAALAARLGKGFVLVRKQGKLPPPVVDATYDLEYGSGVLEMQPGSGRIVLIDDVLATGGTMSAAADLCVRAGYRVQALVTLIDLKLVGDYLARASAARGDRLLVAAPDRARSATRSPRAHAGRYTQTAATSTKQS
jgi:adenine phosphoribosyltransferase